MKLCDNLNQNEYKIIFVLMKENLYFLFINEHLLQQIKFLASIQISSKSRLVNVIPRQCVNV